MDIWDKKKRSQVMSRIKSKDTKIEIIVRKWLFAYGYRFRVNDKRYPGTPDIVLPRYKTIIFVHGCFWHGHNCKIGHVPKSNTAFWREKIGRNKNRDFDNIQQLTSMGWRVLVVWECEVYAEPEIRLIPLLSEIRGVDYEYLSSESFISDSESPVY